MNHKFIYTFVDDDKKEEKSTKPKSGKSNNVLSITAMTDDAMSHRSRATSSAKSDRSFASDDGENNFADTKSTLCPPTSGCIKFLLAEHYKENLDLVGWAMSEKLDGVRCFWTVIVMYSRNGSRYFPSQSFHQKFAEQSVNLTANFSSEEPNSHKLCQQSRSMF